MGAEKKPLILSLNVTSYRVLCHSEMIIGLILATSIKIAWLRQIGSSNCSRSKVDSQPVEIIRHSKHKKMELCAKTHCLINYVHYCIPTNNS